MRTSAPPTTVSVTPRLSRREVFGGGGGIGGGIFETFFGGMAGHAEDRQRGADLRYDMQITLEEAAFGAEKEIEVRKQDICDKCGGTGAESGSRSITCPVCGGRGQVISSRGFFQVSQTCPRCGGVGHIVEKPCRGCGATSFVAQRRSRYSRRSAGRSLCCRPHPGAQNFSARGRQLVL